MKNYEEIEEEFDKKPDKEKPPMKKSGKTLGEIYKNSTVKRAFGCPKDVD